MHRLLQWNNIGTLIQCGLTMLAGAYILLRKKNGTDNK